MVALPVPTEHEEQVRFVNWLETYHSEIWFYAVPNGGKRHIRTAVTLKAEGVKRGVPDLHFPMLGLWVEMKRQRGGKLSPEQKGWIQHLESIGDTVLVCKGADQAIEQFTEFLEAKRE